MKHSRVLTVFGILLALAAARTPARADLSRRPGEVSPRYAEAPKLRILTINAWSGLDYEGFASFGEYEPKTRREARFVPDRHRGEGNNFLRHEIHAAPMQGGDQAIAFGRCKVGAEADFRIGT